VLAESTDGRNQTVGCRTGGDGANLHADLIGPVVIGHTDRRNWPRITNWFAPFRGYRGNKPTAPGPP
jgi:hypothetical protein